MDWLMKPVNEILAFINSGIYDLIVQAYAYFIEIATIIKLKTFIFTLEFSYDIAEQLITNLGITQTVNTAWSYLPPEVLGILLFLAIPQGLNLLITTAATVFVLRFIRF